jgi:hypothetical protein
LVDCFDGIVSRRFLPNLTGSQVAGRRQRYLHLLRRNETDAKFASLAGSIDIDWAHIDVKVKQELEAEKTRPGAKPYAP